MVTSPLSLLTGTSPSSSSPTSFFNLFLGDAMEDSDRVPQPAKGRDPLGGLALKTSETLVETHC